jgi:hypothetical protein
MFTPRPYLFFVALVLACFSFTPKASSQWYKVPSSGEVNFTLTEFWAVLKGPASQNLVLGDATVTVGYPDGQQTQIAFQQSGPDVEVDLQNAGYIEANGTTTWTQVAYLNPGTVFRIVSTTMAQADDPFKPFEGGQAGAYVFGFSRGISTDAPLTTAGNSGPTLTTNPPPPLTGGAGSSSNIHAIVISGLSDPAKVIVSPNVTLTGGIIALGKAGSPPSTASTWSLGLKIVPDHALLTGAKIPPVTPNIIDVRILKQEVTADFPAISPQPNN